MLRKSVENPAERRAGKEGETQEEICPQTLRTDGSSWPAYPDRRQSCPRSCIADPELKLYQYTAIDEYSRYRILGAYPEQSTYSSADFLQRVVDAFRRKGVTVECVQPDLFTPAGGFCVAENGNFLRKNSVLQTVMELAHMIGEERSS